jgi:TldD protein
MLVFIAAVAPVFGAQAADDSAGNDDPVLRAMGDEIARSMQQLAIPGKPKPYYIRYEVTDARTTATSYELGAKISESSSAGRTATIDMHVGGYDFDNTYPFDSTNPLQALQHMFRRAASRSLPLDGDYLGVRRQLWLLSDDSYKQATERFEQADSYKRGHKVRHLFESFSREQPHRSIAPLIPEHSLKADWHDRIRRLSLIFKDYPQISTGAITVETDNYTMRVVNSEGTMTRFSWAPIYIALCAYSRTADGVDNWDTDCVSANCAEDLPDQQALEKQVRRFAENLVAAHDAERRDYYYGPVLFEGQSACELVGHGIAPLLCADPGDRLHPAKTLVRSLNMRIAPQFLSISDDPALKVYQGQTITGHSIIDSDGIPVEKTQLVDHGFLRNLLAGRTPVFPGQHSNGHNLGDEPTPTTLVVQADKTSSPSALTEKLVQLAKDRGLKEAIIVERIVPQTSLTLNGSPKKVRNDSMADSRLLVAYAVDVSTGRKTRIRGLSISNFGRASMENILAAGDDSQAYFTVNWRGYERSVITPSLLVNNLELDEDTALALSPHPVENFRLPGRDR